MDSETLNGLLGGGGLLVVIAWFALVFVVVASWILLPFILYFRLRAIEKAIDELRLTIMWKVDTKETQDRK